jgi:acetyl esterase/lipase
MRAFFEEAKAMSENIKPEDIAKKVVVYRLPGMDSVKVRRDVVYRETDAGALTMDIYYPPDAQSEARMPAVVFVAGYPDAGFQRIVGCKFKEMGAYVSWGQLTAASGLVAITYTNVEPAADIDFLLEYVRQNAAGLGIDENRIGVWACSGNVPLALSALMQEGNDYLRCAVLCYGLMLDLDGSTHVAEAAKVWGFVNPCAGKSVDDLPQDLPLFIARAGQDQMPHLNETIDSFLAKALTHNLPLTFVNHPAAPHAFDLMHDSEASREIIRQILAFMQRHLRG